MESLVPISRERKWKNDNSVEQSIDNCSRMDISIRGRGRNSGNEMPATMTSCLCYRPRCLVLCVYCGFHILGRVRYTCPLHPQTVFLIDLTQCPHCRAYESFLCEFRDQEANA